MSLSKTNTRNKMYTLQYYVLILYFGLVATALHARTNHLPEYMHGHVNRVAGHVTITANNRDSIATTEHKTRLTTLKTFRKFKTLEKYNTPVIKSTSVTKPNKGKSRAKLKNAKTSEKWLEMAKETFKKIEDTKNYIDELKADLLVQLPVAITPKTISNTKYTVGIAKAVFTPSITKLTVFLKVETARGTLILGAEDVKLSHDGGIVGEAKLNLISEFKININQGKIVVTLNGDFKNSKTYATIDCFGFKELSIDAEIAFSNDVIFPVNEDGKRIEAKQVTAEIKTEIADWNDWVVNISLPEFGVKGLDGTTFRLNTAVLDFSDLRNDEAIPSNYLQTYYSANPLLWRGVYVKSLEVVLPKAFKKNKSNKRLTFTGTEMLIDDSGITGTFQGENILSIDEGSASKWKFSLDFFKVALERNTLLEGEFNGEMVLPVSKKSKLGYNAIIQPDEYVFRVSNSEALDFDVWNASVTLTKDSYVEMKVKDDVFRPKASLNGSFDVASGLSDNKAPKEDKTIQFKGIVFEKLEIQTEAPKFTVAYFGVKGKLEIANFPVSINEIGLRLPSGDKAELIFDFNINLTSEKDGGNGGGSKLAFKAKLEEDNGREKWKFDGVDLERVFIQMDVAGMQLKGAIFIFEDDPVYGKGFAGAVGAKLTMGMKLDLDVKALFGRTKTFRYWFADAQVTLPTPIPIFTGFAINSFGGGFYNRMKMDGIDRSPNAAYNSIGASTSGVVYKPYEENGFGFKASIGIITQNSEELFNASVEFGMAFLRSGGLQDIYFKGEGRLISGIPGDFYEKLSEKLSTISKGGEAVVSSFIPDAAMSANVFIKFDFVNDIFHATSELYINFGSFLKGVGPNGRAGWLDFYVSRDKWHILIGTPNDPVGTKMNILIAKLKTTSYFMMGDDLPGSPPPPPMVANLLGVDASKLDYTRDLNKLKSGKGMAFGSHFYITTGDLKFLIFYARFDAGFGFDLMLKDYGDAHCVGETEQIGMNGWYANGQAYAFLQGKVGIRIKIFGKKKKKDIFSGSAAVLVQTRLPNPAWFRGYFRGRFSILGGLIKGSFRFKIELGKKCEVVGGSVLDGIVVIGDIVPKENAANVDVFALPQVAFNLPINKVFELPDDTGDHYYRIMVDKFELTKDGKILPGTVTWNDANDSATFSSHDVLPPNSKVKVYVQLHFEERDGGNWNIIKEDGKVFTEIKEHVFNTGVAPKHIPTSNIEYAYPVLEQKNLYTKESPVGYVQLVRGQSYLFDAQPGWEKQLSLEDGQSGTLNTTFAYNSATKKVSFTLPKGMVKAQPYALKLAVKPTGSKTSSNTLETQSTKELETGKTGNTVGLRSRKVKETRIKDEERVVLTYNFRTSKYTTFKNKVSAMRKEQDLFRHLSLYELTLQQSITADEPFDLVELVGNRYTKYKPLIRARANLDNKYYKDYIAPLLYFNEKGVNVTRNTETVGVPPVEAVQPVTSYITYLENGVFNTEDYNPYSYNLTSYYYKDYLDLRHQLILQGDPQMLEKHKELIVDPFPVMKRGDYKTEWQYTLPGTNTIQPNNTYYKTIKYYNPLHD